MSWTQQDTSFKKLQNKRITTSTGKGINEEKGASTLELYLPDIKTDLIPGIPPGTTTSVLSYTGAIGQTLVVDTSVPGNLTWFATSGYGNTTLANDGSQSSEEARLMGWISDKYDAFGTVSGAGYEIKVYDKNNNLITKTDPSDWLFDYQTGILAFNNASTSYGTVATSGPFRVVGYRYIGNKGIITGAYGGLGFTTYNLGDILVGAGSTFIKLGVGSAGQYLISDPAALSGIAWTSLSVAATGITGINGLTATSQFFATGTSGIGFNISSIGSTHTFNIPIAGTGVTGLITGFAQTIAGEKTFTSSIIGDLTGTATTATYALQSGYAITSGFATTSYNVNVVNSTSNSTHSLIFTPGLGTLSGVALSSNSTISYNPSTFVLSTPGLAVTSATASTNSSTGALIVTGGVGIGGSLFVSGDLTVNGTTTTINSVTLTVDDKNIELGSVSSPSDVTAEAGGITLKGTTDKFINWYTGTGWSSNQDWNLASGLVYKINNTSVLSASSLGTGVTNSSLTAVGTITTGTWAGSLITALYGGTGYSSYTKGDILVGAGSTFIKLAVGTDNYVLTASSSSATGLTWSLTAATGITNINSLTATQQYFATGVSGTGFNISSSGSTHTFNIPIAGTGATGLVSTQAQSFAGTKTFTGDVIVSSTTGSTAYNTGSLTVYGGLGVSGQLSFNQAALGYTGATNPSVAFIGSTNSAPITLTVLSDNSLLWEGTSGKLFGINNNLSSGWIFNVGDISGLPIIRANADGTIAMAEFAANVGIGLSNPSYKLHVAGDTNLSSGYVYRINGTSVLSSTQVLGLTVSSGNITSGTWSGTAISAPYGGTGLTSYTVGDILYASGSATIGKLSAGSAGSVLVSAGTGATPYYASAASLTSGNATTASNINVVNATSSTNHTLLFSPSATGSGVAVSSNTTLSYNPSSLVLSVSGLAVTAGTASTNSSTGALVVTGGVGIGGSLFVSGDLTIDGTTTTINSVTLTVDDKNIELGSVSSPSDVTAEGGGITLKGTTDKLINWYTGTGWSSSESWNLAAGNTYKINNTSVLSASSLGTGVTNSSLTALGTITTGTWAATAITSLYGGTGLTPSFTVGDILYANTSSTWGRLTANSNVGYVLTSAGSGATPTYVAQSTLSVGSATTATYALQSGYAITSGIATTATNLNTVAASTNATHYVLFSPVNGGSGVAVSSDTGLTFNPSSNTVSLSTLSATTVNSGTVSITGSTASTSTSSGALVVTGGVGIGGSLNVASATAISGVTINNGIITGNLTGTATTATNFNAVTASTNAAHPLLFSPSISGSGIAASTNSTISYNPSTNILSSSGLAVTASTVSTSSSTGALVVTGGVGIGGTVYTATDLNVGNSTTGRLYFSQATLGSAGTTVIPTMAFIGATNSPITLSVLADNSLSFDGSSGQLFSINNNLSSGWIFAVNDISGLPLLRANADGTVAMGEFAGNTGIGLSNPSYKLHVAGDTNLSSSYVYRINGTSVLSASSLGTGVTNSSLTALGTITTGTWAGSTITARYGGTGYTTYTKGDLLVGAGSTFLKFGVGSDNQILIASSYSGSGLSWAQFSNPSYGSFYSTSTQQVVGAGATTLATFNNTYEANRVQILGGAGTSSRIQIQDAGPYSLTFSAQINLISGTQPKVGDMWFRVNGVDVPQSNTEMTISGKDFQTALTVNFVYSFQANDYVEIAFSSDDSQYSLESRTGLTSPPRPDIPSIILSVLPVTHVIGSSGTATSGIQVLNGAVQTIQYFQTGTTGSDFNISTAGAYHTFNIPDASTTARGLVTTGSQTILGSKTFASGFAITASTASTSSSTGALIVSGGVGIGGSLYTSSSYANSVSGVVLNNGVITSGSWAGSTITGLYGGTGYTSYTKGDILVGAGNTFVKLSTGTDGYVLGANSSLPSGLGWTTVSGVAISTSPPSTPKNADLWFNSTDGSLSVYYQDVDTSQWVEIAIGSGIDLTNDVHITSTTGSTSVTNGALIVDGGVGIAGTANIQSVVINELYDQIGVSLTTSATTANQVALNLSTSAYRSAKLFVQASSGTTFHSQEIMMMHDGTNVYMTEYSMVNSGAIGSTFDGDISGGNMRFLVTPTYAVTTYKIACTAMRI